MPSKKQKHNPNDLPWLVRGFRGLSYAPGPKPIVNGLAGVGVIFPEGRVAFERVNGPGGGTVYDNIAEAEQALEKMHIRIVMA